MKKPYNKIPLFLSTVFTLLFAGCPMTLDKNAADNAVPPSADKTDSFSFGAEWIIRQQEQGGTPDTARDGYSIVKTADYFDTQDFNALNAVIISELDLHDGYKYFLVKTEADAVRFRAEVRKINGTVYAQPDYRYDAPSVVKSYNNSANRGQFQKHRKDGTLPFGTQDGNLADDPQADLADWGLTVTGALEAFKLYDASAATNQVLVAIVDTGVNSLHEDLYDGTNSSIVFYAKSSLHRGNFTEYRPLKPVPINENWDNVGHGTHCSGTIAAVGNNNKGICGVSHAHTKLITYRGLDLQGGSSYSVYSCIGDLAAIVTELRKEPALRDAAVFAGLPAHVIASPKLTQKTVPVNLSLGGYAIHPYEVEMMNKALAAGVLPVIAMGNNGKTVASFPAALQGILAVGATTMYDTRAAFSNGGSWISICAPGESIFSCGNGGSNWSNYGSADVKQSYLWMSGTSMATPFVTGTIAYLLSINPDLSAYQLKTVLEHTADKIDRGSAYGSYDAHGFSKWYGYGRVNVLKAAQAVQTGSGIPEPGAVYSERAVKITVQKAGAVQKNMQVWLYEKQSGICAAVGLTDDAGAVSFYGLRTGNEYGIGVNDAGVYKTHAITAVNTSDIDYTFSL
uniref:PrtPII n=1 Tax=Treponema sp. OMZ 839 TaxID=244312 RepID=Q6UKM1_9SPIR|nr:PrtPII [Treponema sp. OMZ 839]